MFKRCLLRATILKELAEGQPICNRHLSSRLHHVRMLLQETVMVWAETKKVKGIPGRSWIWNGRSKIGYPMLPV